MASLQELKSARLQKLARLKEHGMNPYPSTVARDFSLSELRDSFDERVSKNEIVSIAGRIMSIRGQGAILFVTLFDGTDKFQAILKKDEIEEVLFVLFNEGVDIGDFISVTGPLLITQRGEKSIVIHSWTMASKTLLPLPEKWHGITDPDERYRKRYLDLLMTDELRELFVLKSKFWEVTRTFLKENGFLEVETPTLEVTTGGAEANPFKTHHKDFDLDVFMRISVGELWQKRLMAAGFTKTFEIGKVYRNEGTSPDHLQEFTNMEFYWAFAGTKEGKEIVKKLYRTIALEVFGKTEFTTRGHTFDLAHEWEEIDYVEKIKAVTGVDILSASESQMQEKLQELGVKFTGTNKERLTDSLWKYCRKQISGPAFLVNHPKLVAPLSKNHPTEEGKTDMFQVLLAGSEIGRAHAELNDPIEQAERFNIQQQLIQGGDNEAMMEDKEYIEMLEHGMPPTFGFGFGERFFAFLVDKPIRETQLFPLMRPKETEE